MSNININGYSERGMINAIFYEIKYSLKGIELLRELLSLCKFPKSKPDLYSIQNAKIIIEQSFSDFGDLDVLILLDGNYKQSVLIEAKVKTFQRKKGRITKEWEVFKKFPQCKNGERTSSLFIQLYRKMRLIQQVRNGNITLERDAITKRLSLGKNEVVLRAANEFKDYAQKSWLVALVPDSQDDLHRFFTKELPSYTPYNMPDWNISNLGYLSWKGLEDYCNQHADDWKEARSNFEYNQGQIY